MPYKPLGPCCVRGCPGRAIRRGRCERHAAEADARYRAQHPDTRPSASRRGYGPEWKAIRDAFLKAHPFCANGDGKTAKHVDHIKARAQGGSDDPSNLRALCHSCHSTKTNQVDGGFGNKVRYV